jgi:ring-1,2-phenylacetyl-CoA epoxidase subunit PaaD
VTGSVLHDRPDPVDFEVHNGVMAALRAVDDPEFPAVSIVDLGILEDVRVGSGRVEVDLVPTYSGCPALDLIAADVRAAVATVDGVEAVVVRFVAAPAWTPDRITDDGRRRMAADLAVAVARPGRPTRCPSCGAPALMEESMFGPVRCRAIHRCPACGERIEVVR